MEQQHQHDVEIPQYKTKEEYHEEWKILGAKFRAEINSRGQTQTFIAGKIGCSVQNINNLLSGRQYLRKIAGKLNDLLGVDFQIPSPLLGTRGGMLPRIGKFQAAIVRCELALLGINETRIAEQLGVSKQLVNYFMRGRGACLRTRKAIADAIGIDPITIVPPESIIKLLSTNDNNDPPRTED